MTCTQSLITSKIAEIKRALNGLKLADVDSWWNIPEINETLASEWVAAIGLDGMLTFSNVPSSTGFYDSNGFIVAKTAINNAITLVNSLSPMVRQTGGRFLLQESTLTLIESGISVIQQKLQTLISSRWLNRFYDLPPSRVIGVSFESGDQLNGISVETRFYISRDELTDKNNSRNSLVSAIEELDLILSYISASDCNEPPQPNDDNCDRIADALEAIAAKDFNCDTQPVLDAIEDLKDLLGNDFVDGIKVPKLITQPPKDNKGKDSDYVIIKSMPEFMVWQFKQIDALFGRFPIKIVQSDGDLTEEGDQETTIVIPNLSEGISELIALNAVQLSNSEAILKSSVSNIGETVLIKKMLIQCKWILDNIQDWTGLNTRDRKETVPFAVDIRETELDKLLQPAEIEILVDEHKPLNDGSEFNIERIGKIVNTIYAIVSAAYVNRLDPDDPVGSIRRDLDKIKNGLNLVDNEDEDGFSTFLERTELAFGDAPLSNEVTNPNPTGPKPYGREYNRRPLIRRTEGQGTDDIKEGDTDQGDGDGGGDP